MVPYPRINVVAFRVYPVLVRLHEEHAVVSVAQAVSVAIEARVGARGRGEEEASENVGLITVEEHAQGVQQRLLLAARVQDVVIQNDVDASLRQTRGYHCCV